MLARLLHSLRTELYLSKGCQELLSRRFHQSTVGCTVKKNLNEIKNEEAVEWLSDLSPEMQERKIVVENLIETVQQDHYELLGLEISPADLKCMMIECQGFIGVRKYLRFKRKTTLSKKAKEAKRLEKQKAELEHIKQGNALQNEDIVSSYTMQTASQISRHDRHRGLMPLMGDAVSIIFDLDYKQTTREQTRTVHQIKESSHTNKMFSDPCQIHVTSYKKNENFLLNSKVGYTSRDLTLHEEGFEDIFPLEKLVYLSPDAPQLRYHTPGDIYIIAGLVDLHSNIPVSLKKAKQLNIRCGSIPFMRHAISPGMVKSSTKYVLTLNAVFELVLDINLRHNWSMVIKDFVKTRQSEARRQEHRNRNMMNRGS